MNTDGAKLWNIRRKLRAQLKSTEEDRNITLVAAHGPDFLALVKKWLVNDMGHVDGTEADPGD